jgi:hypothetical protein
VNGAGERSPLDVERDALVSLGAPPSQRERFQLVPVGQALTELAELTRGRARRSSRLLVLERLVRAAGRPGNDLVGVENAGGLRDLLDALLEVDAGIHDPSAREGGVVMLEEALVSGAGLDPADAYRQFIETTQTNAPLRDIIVLQKYEVFAPTCNDTDIEEVEGHVARKITAEFFSELPFDRFASWLDPESWPALCPWFFRQMDGIPPRNGAPSCVQWYDETVEISAGVRWRTRLRFNHRVFSDELVTDYRLRLPNEADPPGAPPEATAHLVVDQGFLSAQQLAGPQQGFVSRLKMVKIADFVDDEIDSWTTLMCDTFWLTLAIEMANAAAEAADPDEPDDNR